MKTTRFTPSFKVGDKVRVTLPGGIYSGEIKEVLTNYAYTGDTWYLVSGEDPQPFLTTTRWSGLTPTHNPPTEEITL